MIGAALVVDAASFQPFNQNEYAQMEPYGSNDLGTITSGTRQPPLDPLLGSLIQHLLGEGQLRQRLLPVAAGIGTLVLISLLLRRWCGGYAGPAAVFILATQPLMVRYSAYTRPYALPLFLMTLTWFAADRWLATGRWRWLVVAACSSALLPLARVPEPTVFLLASAVVLGWMAARGRLPRKRVVPLVAVTVGALLLVGVAMALSLRDKLPDNREPSAPSFSDRLSHVWDGLVDAFAPTMADSFPWFPVTLAVVVAGLAVPASRRRLFSWWPWWPLVLAPTVFAVAYFTFQSAGSDHPYHARYAVFFLLPYVVLVAALATSAERGVELGSRMRLALAALLAAAFVTQLPATIAVLTDKEAADFGEAAHVLKADVPADAIVVFDGSAPADKWHQSFSGRTRLLEGAPLVISPADIARDPKVVPRDGPVYLLVLDAECVSRAMCDGPTGDADRHIDGWRLAERFDEFTLYESADAQRGRPGTTEALLALADAFGPGDNVADVYAAASLMKLDGDAQGARATIREAYRHLTPEQVQIYRDRATDKGLDPFG